LQLTQYRRGVCKMRGLAYVDGKLAAEADLMARIVDK
jgi:3-hydroxymyristoyl/3-hydroxydecanoyl-(acyl carrier protein) dehydratase